MDSNIILVEVLALLQQKIGEPCCGEHRIRAEMQESLDNIPGPLQPAVSKLEAGESGIRNAVC
jgi:hypothetical protein